MSTIGWVLLVALLLGGYLWLHRRDSSRPGRDAGGPAPGGHGHGAGGDGEAGAAAGRSRHRHGGC